MKKIIFNLIVAVKTHQIFKANLILIENIHKNILKTVSTSLQVHTGISKKGRVKVHSFFYFLLSLGAASSFPPHPLNPPTPLLHPANINTPSSHWKTSVFWGQGWGPTSNLPQPSHMKHLESGQGEAGRKELGVGSTGGRGVVSGREWGLSEWMTFSWVEKRALWVQCAQLHQAALHTHDPRGNSSQWATILDPPSLLSPSPSLVMKNKNKAFPKYSAWQPTFPPTKLHRPHHRPHLYARRIFDLACSSNVHRCTFTAAFNHIKIKMNVSSV